MLLWTNQQTTRATDPLESSSSTEPPIKLTLELNISKTLIDLPYPKSDNEPKDKNTVVCYL